MTTAAATWTGFPCLLRSHSNSTFYPFANFSANFVKFITNCQVSHQAVVFFFFSAQMKNVNLTVWWKPIKKETLNNVRGVPPPRKLTIFCCSKSIIWTKKSVAFTNGDSNDRRRQQITRVSHGKLFFFIFSLSASRQLRCQSVRNTHKTPTQGAETASILFYDSVIKIK